MRSLKLLWGVIGVLFTAVVVLAVLLLVRSGAQTPQTGEPPSRPQPADPGESSKTVAVIGSRSITKEELQHRLEDKYGTELLGILLDREAIRQEAEQKGLSVSREEIDAELKRMQEGYESEEQFYLSMKTQLGLTKAELNEDVYYKLLLEHIATSSIQVSEAEIDGYIKQHPEEFRSYMQFNLFKIEVKTKEEAAQIVKDVQNGADFASLARKLSIDQATAPKGGDLGWVEENDPFLQPFLLEAAKNLKQGEVSKPIALKSSFAVVLLKDKKVVNKTVDTATRNYIRKELALQRAVPLKEIVKSLRQKFNAEILIPDFR
ncbi:MAG: peptidyl-prolyl cis-trans isomerase [Paenibacillus sp.]|jgi:foldase protein PrsA|uniref:peptidylprolyl isomerase n=1 Tax=Paenibacillus sp. GCM10012303 TaxID=3317340 RepID=UPI0029EACEA2|nr:peptidyl-prolyl cis-trans isomerase [Paenibacillus sp.]